MAVSERIVRAGPAGLGLLGPAFDVGQATPATGARFGIGVEVVAEIRRREREAVLGAMAAADAAFRDDPLGAVVEAAGRVGELIEDDVVVRAGVILAARWNAAMPGPPPDPAELWRPFLVKHLAAAGRSGVLPASLDVGRAASFLAELGLGVRDHQMSSGSLSGLAATLRWAVGIAISAWQVAAAPTPLLTGSAGRDPGQCAS